MTGEQGADVRSLSTFADNLRDYLSRMHAIVLGPGLGRDERRLKLVEVVCETAREKRIPLTIDADALWYGLD